VPTIPTSNQRIAARHYDFESNGFVAVTERFTYDNDGRVTEIDFMPADGASGFPGDVLPFSFGGNQENRTTFAYNANGQIESFEVETFDRDPDRVPDRRSVFTFTWDNATYVITEARAEFYDIGDGGALQSSLLSEITYSTQQVTGWNEIVTNIIPIDGLPDLVTQDVIALAYGANNLPQTRTETKQYGGTNTITYTWDDGGFALESSEADSNLDDTRENVYTYTDAGKIESRTEVFRGNTQNQTLYNYDTDNRLENIIYDTSPFTPDTTINIEWESASCQPTMMWATGAEASFIASGNEPYIPATGYFQLNFCNL